MEILADVFPAEVVMPDKTVVQRARVFVTELGIYIYHQVGANAELKYSARHEEHPVLPSPHAPRSHFRLTARVADGELLVTRARGCGCGNPVGTVALRQQFAEWVGADV